ncbi:MAG: hypothetical protein AAGJ10_09595 [Bacteroidota bacterium]
MLRSVTATFILFAIVLAPAHAQVSASLPPDVQQAFDQTSLHIELPGLQAVSSYGDTVTFGDSHHWTAYRGYTRLSESDFFALANQDALAQSAKRTKRARYLAIGLGGLSFISGALLFGSGGGFDSAGNLNTSMRPQIIGGLLMGAGSVSVGLGAIGLTQRSVPYWMAQEVADDYNDQLIQALSQE